MIKNKTVRILAIAPLSRGLGYAVMEGPDKLVACGNKAILHDKNARALAWANRFIQFYQPDVLVLPNVGAADTFTLDPKNYANEETAFEDSRDWLRKLFYQLRQGVEHEGKTYVIDAPYCIKVEFHESGWVHFHAIFLTRRFLPKELLAELWDRGWVTVQRITTTDFHYLLKYVTKADDLPEWVRKRKRLRVFQTTKGFLKPLPPKPKTISLKEPRKRASYTMAIIVIACQRTSFANAASTVTGSSAGAPPAGEENSLLISQKNCAIQQPTQGKCRKASAAFSST